MRRWTIFGPSESVRSFCIPAVFHFNMLTNRTMIFCLLCLMVLASWSNVGIWPNIFPNVLCNCLMPYSTLRKTGFLCLKSKNFVRNSFGAKSEAEYKLMERDLLCSVTVQQMTTTLFFDVFMFYAVELMTILYVLRIFNFYCLVFFFFIFSRFKVPWSIANRIDAFERIAFQPIFNRVKCFLVSLYTVRLYANK